MTVTVTSFRVVDIKKVGRDLERARADLSTHINSFLSPNWDQKYLSLKMTQCQNFFVKSIENRSKLFLQSGLNAFKIVKMTKARIIM